MDEKDLKIKALQEALAEANDKNADLRVALTITVNELNQYKEQEPAEMPVLVEGNNEED